MLLRLLLSLPLLLVLLLMLPLLLMPMLLVLLCRVGVDAAADAVLVVAAVG